MADRDVILKALVDFCWSKPHLQAIGPDLGRLAEVAELAAAPILRPLSGSLVIPREFTDDQVEAVDRAQILNTGENPVVALARRDGLVPEGAEVVHMAFYAKSIRLDWRVETAPPPVGTPAEARVCAARSGVGEEG